MKRRYTSGRMGSDNRWHSGSICKVLQLYSRWPDRQPQPENWVLGLTGWFVLSLSLHSTLSGFDPDPRERRFGSGLLCRHPTGGLVRLRGLSACPEAWFPRTRNRRSASATSSKQTTEEVGCQVQTKATHLLPTSFVRRSLTRQNFLYSRPSEFGTVIPTTFVSPNTRLTDLFRPIWLQGSAMDSQTQYAIPNCV